MRLQRSDVLLVIVDVQEKLMPVIHDAAAVSRNIERLVRACHVLDVPVLLTEQYVKGLGPTIEPIRRALAETSGYQPIEKSCFSSYGCGEFLAELRTLKRSQLLVAGVEAHVCVYQTAIDLIGAGHHVTILADAVSSRTAENRDVALRRTTAEGALLSSTEMALFELLVTSDTDEFRAISKLIR